LHIFGMLSIFYIFCIFSCIFSIMDPHCIFVILLCIFVIFCAYFSAYFFAYFMHILSIFYAYFDILSAYFICIFLAYFHAYFLHICHIACIFLCIFLCIFHAYFMHILYIFYAYIMHIQHFSCIFSCRFLAYCMHISCMFMSYLSYILHLYTYFMHIWYKSWFDWPSFPVTVVPFKFIVVTVSYSEFWGPCHCPSVDIPPPAPIACSMPWVTYGTRVRRRVWTHGKGDCASIPNWNQCKPSQNWGNGHYIQDLLVLLALIMAAHRPAWIHCYSATL